MKSQNNTQKVAEDMGNNNAYGKQLNGGIPLMETNNSFLPNIKSRNPTKGQLYGQNSHNTIL
jgi:hypothetical protein